MKPTGSLSPATKMFIRVCDYSWLHNFSAQYSAEQFRWPPLFSSRLSVSSQLACCLLERFRFQVSCGSALSETDRCYCRLRHTRNNNLYSPSRQKQHTKYKRVKNYKTNVITCSFSTQAVLIKSGNVLLHRFPLPPLTYLHHWCTVSVITCEKIAILCVFVELQDDDDDDEVFSQTRRQARRTGHLSSEGRLSSLRAVQTFQSFLVGTAGEKFWHLWLDIERARTIRDHTELDRCNAVDSFYRSILLSSSMLLFILPLMLCLGYLQ